MNWREYIARFSSNVEFNPAATASEIADAEAKLNVEFPESLKDRLSQSNGVLDELSAPFIWSTADIAKRNIEMRTGFEELYMPFDHLLFFGDGGTGDLFGFAILAGKVRHWDVYYWDPENDERIWVAGHLEQFIDWWLTTVNQGIAAADSDAAVRKG
jgi:hypothetical protein